MLAGYAYVKLHIYLIFVPLHVRGFSFPPRKVYPLCVYFTLLTVILTPNYNILPHICRLLPPIDSFYILKIKGTKIYDMLSTVWGGGEFFKRGFNFHYGTGMVRCLKYLFNLKYMQIFTLKIFDNFFS